VEIDGLADVAATEVVFPEARILNQHGKRVVQYGPLTLRRGLARSKDWYEWWDRARRSRSRAGDLTRTVRIILIDRLAADVIRWTFLKTVPTAYSVSPLNALASAPIIETLELSVRGFDAAFDLL
jgi:phage tail-like protein